MLEITNATKRFGERTILDGISIAVGRGQSLALLGPSGVGKSTLLRCVAGLEQLDEGTIAIDGVDVSGQPTHKRGVGFLFQSHALFPHLDVGANVAFGLRMQQRSRSERDKRVREVLDLVGLGDALDRNVATLSGGESQRVALARALAPAPSLLLLDEPFGGLDRTRRDQLIVELRTVFDDVALTVVAVTHDPTEAALLADDAAVLVNGTIAQRGSVGTVVSQPMSISVARLVGHVNVLARTASNGRTKTPWGEIATDRDGPIGLLVSPAAITIGTGEAAATVIGELWRDQRRVRLDIGDGVVLEAASTTPCRRGERVSYAVNSSGVSMLTPD